MKSKLRRELQQFLEQERISFNSGIVNYITYQLAEITVNDEQLTQGFIFEKDEMIDKDKITFSIATGLDLSQIKKILTFFKIPEAQYQHGKPILLNNDHIFAYFIFHFKSYFQTLKENSPQIIAKYKALSAPILEANAKNILDKQIAEVKQMIITHYQGTLFTQPLKDLISFISLLSGRIKDLENFPHFYEDILQGKQEINYFLQQKEISSNKELSAQLIMMLESITLFSRYHRNESILNTLALHKELKEFLIPYRINPEKCDLFGPVILSLAELNIHSEHLFQVVAGEDKTRMIMTFKDLNQESVNKIVAQMRYLGDDTAFECETTTDEKRSIQVDGKFFYSCIFPKIKENIEQLAAQHQLANYQEASKEDFKTDIETPRVSEYSLFSNSANELNTFNKKSSRGCICTMLTN